MSSRFNPTATDSLVDVNFLASLPRANRGFFPAWLGIKITLMSTRRNFSRIALLALGVAVHAVTFAQTLQYTTIDLTGRLTVTIPGHWFVRDAAGRQNVAAAANASIDPTGKRNEPIHFSSLSVLSSAEKPQVIFRVSFVEEPGSQAQLQQDLAQGKAAAIRELAQVWKEESITLATTLERQGGRYLGDERFDFLEVGGRKAMLISYRRASLTGGAPFRVNQYHIPMGTDKILITASVQESASKLMQPIVDRMLASVAIRR